MENSRHTPYPSHGREGISPEVKYEIDLLQKDSDFLF